ncbi:MAG: iron transporter FeoB [Bacillaceae bacterium G1]|nr:iron transporter FeoB [Bacillota bacterium]OJF17695.1 MAG: iron transporter FeoB [Bacillaceae bacterium G1]
MRNMTYRIALAGNPNTGKSTLFNALTGLRQHTGNWPGKTVTSAEGTFTHRGLTYTIVDLPGTYSLFSNSADEEVARDYLIFGRPDVTMVVVDATALERNLNLVLQILEITDRVIVVVNLIDEARRQGIHIDAGALASQLGVPVVLTSARNGEGIPELLDVLDGMVRGTIETQPLQVRYSPALEERIAALEPQVRNLLGDAYPSRWIALRLLDGDESLLAALKQKLTAPHEEVSGYEPIRASI